MIRSDWNPRVSLLLQSLENRILVLDGGMGTAIQERNLTAEDFGGELYEGCNELLALTRPELLSSIHESHLKAGSDIVETNTFGGTPLVLDEYEMGSQADEINFKSAQIARKIADQYSTAEKPRFVAGSIGPTTKAISVTGGITFDELIQNFYAQAKALFNGGVDYYLLETCQDTRNIKAATLALLKLFEEEKRSLPIAVSGTIEPTGTMLAGQSVEALMTSLSHLDLLYLGLNCATGPEFMTDPIRSLAKLSPFRVACVPNAGLPDENGNYLETPEMMANVVGRFVEQGWINILGGCCGTTAEHIAALAKVAAKGKPRTPPQEKRSYLSGIDFLEVTDEMRPMIVGERTNVIGSRKFKRLICEEKFEEASEVARAQIKNAAQIVDICLANPDRDEAEDMRNFLEFAVKKVRVPWMIDSTDASVIDLALTYSQGKAIINSVNLEDGEERFEQVLPLAKKYGAALVVGTIDDDPEQGMGISRQRKLEIAERSYELLTKKYHFPEEDIYWDPLVFPCATGDAQYIGSAVETIEGIRLIKKRFPKTKTVLGISNVSFGLPNAGREVLNSVFLYHCVQAGLDLAIVNSEKLERYATIQEKERKLAEALLFEQGKERTDSDPIAEFAAHFRDKKPTQKTSAHAKLPLLERLPNYILEGTKEGLTADLDQALQTMKPLEIINGPLMKGMDEVGKLFNANQLIVAEVLQSAEAMKAAVAHLEPFMEKSDTSSRGKILLATVKGDVHDIGKNLVEIILKNNGFDVINMGIKIPPEQLIQAIREHKPDIVGLSGLLVKSAQQMVVTAEDFSKAGVSTPIMVGGAALTSNFVDKQISKAYTTGTVAYAKDAMNGLDLAKVIVNEDQFESFKNELAERRKALLSKPTAVKTVKSVTPPKRSSQIPVLESLPQAPDLDRHILKNTPIDQIWRFINPLMLYGRHLGVRGATAKKLGQLDLDVSSNDSGFSRAVHELESENPKAYSIWKAVREVKEDYGASEVFLPAAVYQFFQAASLDNDIWVFEKNQWDKPKAKFHLPRQQKPDGLCLSDYIQPLKKSPEDHDRLIPEDTMAFFVVTVGRGVRELSEMLKNRGDYLKSHIVQALALETAEAYAEMLHAQLRKAWGYPDPLDMTMMQRFQAKYHGKRYSFGYPACPNLEDQAKLWDLLKPEEIGAQLTDGFMMDPESSVSALVVHHPDATYFSVGQQSEDALYEPNRQ